MRAPCGPLMASTALLKIKDLAGPKDPRVARQDMLDQCRSRRGNSEDEHRYRRRGAEALLPCINSGVNIEWMRSSNCSDFGLIVDDLLPP